MNQPLLWFIAISMAFTSAWLLKRSSVAKSSLVNSITFYVLVMMAAMFVGAVFYLAHRTQFGLAEALGLNMIVMSVGVIAVLQYWTKDDSIDEREGSLEELGKSDESELQRSIDISRAYVVYFLVMMASMTAVGFVYVLNTALVGLNEGLLLGNAIMIPGIVIILWYASKHPNVSDQPRIQSNQSRKIERWILVFLVLLNEFVMGWAFVLASGNSEITNGSLLNIVFSTLNYVTGTDWFLFTLALEIAFSIYMLRNFFSVDFIRIAYLQSLLLIFIPTTIDVIFWPMLCVIAGVAILSSLAVLSYHLNQQKNSRDESLERYLRLLLVLNALILVGTLTWIFSGNVLILLSCVIVWAVLYFSAILERIIPKGEHLSTPATTLLPAAKDSL